MSVAHTLKRGAAASAVTLLALLAGAVASAAAAQPWWHLDVDSAPTVLKPGVATDEVQQITVSATGGGFELRAKTPPDNSHAFAWDATHQELQEGLEEMYGAGNVEVPKGQGNETGSEPYEVIFKGAFADRFVQAPTVTDEFVHPTGGEHEVTVKQITQGRSDGTLLLTAANMSGEDLSGSPVTVAVELPAGLTATHINATSGLLAFGRPECSLETLSCTTSETVMPYEQIQVLVAVNVNPGAQSREAVGMLVSGGDARPASISQEIGIGDAQPQYGFENYEMTPEEADGSIDTQAGSHPFQLTTTLMLNQRELVNEENENGFYYKPKPAGYTKDLAFKLPPGLIGDPTPFAQCQLTKFLKFNEFADECPNDTAIGVAAVTIEVHKDYPLTTVAVPLFNLTPSVGEPARFGFMALGVPVYLDTAVRTGGDYGVTVKVENITQEAAFVGSRVTFWGVPGDPRHDYARGWSCIADGIYQGFTPFGPCAATEAHSPPPLLELPTSCTGPLRTTVEGDPWEAEGDFVSSEPRFPLPSLDGCNQLPFSPSISVAPDGQAGSTPTGLTVGIHVPQEVSLDPGGLGSSDLETTQVTLPPGVTLNPSAADGLLACSEGQIGLHVDAPPTCPESSKVGTVEIETPLLPNPLLGAVYLATPQNFAAPPQENVFEDHVALYLVAEDPISGTLIKLAGKVELGGAPGVEGLAPGQLRSTFPNNPQLPFEDATIHFFGGERAPLTSPARCGAYTTEAAFTPWSGAAPVSSSSTFQVTSGPNGSPCPGTSLPFKPTLASGSINNNAGAFSDLTTTMSRADGEQQIAGVTLHYPPGLSGMLSGVELCPEAEANAGTCGPNSQIGETIVSIGLGGDPFTVTGGKVYLTEKYDGAPFGLSIVNPAKAGPFDLQEGRPVVVRAKVEVDPLTAALTVTTDPAGTAHSIPTIIEGFPLQIRHVNVLINRHGFIFNPTSCERDQVTGTIDSAEGASTPTADSFQVANCAALKFAPKFKASTQAKTSRRKGASLHVSVGYPNAAQGTEANVRYVKVELPKQLPSELKTLQEACLARVFEANPANCPEHSLVGHAVVHTPVLPVPLTGPAYFVSHGGAKFPELVLVLQGYGVTIYLHGETFINKKGITSSTFKSTPDVPFRSFELTLPEGPYSALASNLPKKAKYSFCGQKLIMPTTMIGQNGAKIEERTKIKVTGCKTAHKKHKKHHKHKKHKDNHHGTKRKHHGTKRKR